MNTPEQMKHQFSQLYQMMAGQEDVRMMHVFGQVHKEMMDWLIANKPELAQEWLDKLESIKWHQYLTPKEAQFIVDKMVPAAPWKRDVWNNAMQSLEIPTEEAPYYNSCALWVEMNKQYSDHAESLAQKVWKKPLSSIPSEEIVPAIHSLALDVLKDKDGIYNIRRYFNIA